MVLKEPNFLWLRNNWRAGLKRLHSVSTSWIRHSDYDTVQITMHKHQQIYRNTVADPGFSKWGGAVLSQMGGAHPVFR